MAVERQQGRVKWFSQEREFGFISADDGEIFVHAQQTPNQKGLKTGQIVSFRLGRNAKGSSAQEVIIEQESQAAARKVGTIARLCKDFGFINIEGEPASIFFHFSQVRASDLGVGDTVSFSIDRSHSRGPQAEDVTLELEGWPPPGVKKYAA